MMTPVTDQRPTDPVREAKTRLRHRLRAERLAFAANAPALTAPNRLMALFRPGLIVAGYIALQGEADAMPLMLAATDRGCRLALPHVTSRAAPMRFLAWSPGDLLVTGPMGLSQPRQDAHPIDPDIFLTPLLGFDAKLNRLGQGAGFYDRAFAKVHGGLRIGVAWSIQQCDTLPVDAWDVPLDGVVTELGWHERETD